ncbi:UNVERIFIED_CONTAM: hypothetical protein Sradi_4178400 [Sesamum radiatum]|uniref:Extensin-like n=1 Tax=Sesamum radiatum TaxID=300843 RepID=A0AAW2P5F0_SESRA
MASTPTPTSQPLDPTAPPPQPPRSSLTDLNLSPCPYDPPDPAPTTPLPPDILAPPVPPISTTPPQIPHTLAPPPFDTPQADNTCFSFAAQPQVLAIDSPPSTPTYPTHYNETST